MMDIDYSQVNNLAGFCEDTIQEFGTLEELELFLSPLNSELDIEDVEPIDVESRLQNLQ